MGIEGELLTADGCSSESDKNYPVHERTLNDRVSSIVA